MKFQNKPYHLFAAGSVICTSVILLFINACEKIEPERIVKVRTDSISEIQYSTSVAAGILVDIADDGVNEHGHCWATTNNPSINSSARSMLGSRNSNGSFVSHLEDLSPATTYYIRAYAQIGNDVTYGEIKSFSTLTGNFPSVITNEAKTVTMNSAICGGEITSENGYPVTSRGICWNTTGNPGKEENPIEMGSGPGNFESQITGLDKRTTYYVKAYATNQLGTNYGGEIIFSTSDFPSIHTVDINIESPNSASCIGNVTDDGLSEVVKGFCWSTDPGPSIDSPHAEYGNGTGEFEIAITELSPATQYFIRAYATNINGTVYGSEIVIVTPFMDNRDLKIYQVTRIGEQYWMAENLNFGNYIPTTESQSENEIIEKYCFNDNEANCELFGGYYTWNEMMQYVPTESAQGVCPDGWHIPSDAEWKTMEMALGMTPAAADAEYWRGTDEGGKLKQQGTELWQFPNDGATNESGFSALPGGYYDLTTSNDFVGATTSATFWVSTKAPDAFTAYYRTLDYSTSKIYRFPGYQGNRTPVRCVKD